jgi:hypothetical protein
LSNNRADVILDALWFSALGVAAIIVVHGLSHGWGELSEPGYWVEKAGIFVVMAVVIAAFNLFRRPGGKP